MQNLESSNETLKTFQGDAETGTEAMCNKEPNEAAADVSIISDISQGDIIKSQEDKIQLLQAELTDLNYVSMV